MSQEVVTSDANVAVRTQYDLIMTTNLDGGLSNLLMKPTETYFFEAYIISTNPVTNLEFEIGTLFGDVDALHFGIPVVNFGSAFRFTKSWPSSDGDGYDGRLHHLTETVSNTGRTVRKRRWRLLGALNAEAYRDSTKDDNKVISYSQSFLIF